MKKQNRIHFSSIAIILLTLMLVNCSTNRLHEYEFKNTTAAADMLIPPRAQVFSDSFFYTDGDPVSTVLRIGTTIAKSIEAGKAQKKLDRAMNEVDIPEEIRIQTLEQSAEYLHFQPVDEPADADFVFIMKIDHYGIEASSWAAAVHFKIDINVRLVDNAKHLKIWEKTIKERMVVSSSIFGLHDSIGDVITASVLSDLTEEEMIEGFTHLGQYAADMIAERIQDDFIKAHSKHQ